MAGLDRTEAAALIRRDDATRVVLLGGDPDQIAIRKLLAVVDRRQLRAAAANAIVNHSDVLNRAETVYEVVGLAGPEVPLDQRATALIVIARIAATLLDAQARAVLARCLQLAAQPIDPYEAPDLASLARTAATAILEEHPRLDALIYRRLAEVNQESDVVILATALVRRATGRATAIADLCKHWKPTVEQARRFGGNADVLRSPACGPTPVTIVSRQRRPAWLNRAPLARAHLLPFVVAAVVWATWDWRWKAPPLQVGFPEALGALALVAAIHVVSAQLVAARLEGVLARYSTNSTSLAVSYWAAATMAVCSITGQNVRLQEALGWGGTFSAVVFIGSAIAAAWSLVRQTDPGRAARAFARHRRRFYIRSGTRLGRFQGGAETFRDSSLQLPFLSLTTEPLHVERRVPIVAGRRGMLLPHLSRLQRLGRRASWAQGHLRLQVLARVGTIVPEGAEVGAILPDATSTIGPNDRWRARRTLERLRSVRTIEDAAEGVIVLVSVAGRLARDGDRGGAERTAGAVRSLLGAHLDAAFRSRRRSDPLELVPATPAFRDALSSIVTQLAESHTDLAVEVIGGLLRDCLLLGQPSDAAIPIVISRLDSVDGLKPITFAGLLRTMARRCLETRDLKALGLVQQQIERKLAAGQTWDFMEAASEVPSLAAWLDQPRAMGAWNWYWRVTAPTQSATLRVRLASRIGAANLEAGSVSVAIAVVLDLRNDGVDFGALATLVTAEDNLSRESVWSHLSGGYLGPDPAVSLRTFMTFAQTTAATIQP